MKKISKVILLFGFGILWIFTGAAEAHDFSLWDSLLKKHLSPTTIQGVKLNALDYKKLKQDPQFKALLDGLEKASIDAARPQQMSFWINTYNIMAVKMVVDHYPLKSIKDAGSLLTPVWKQGVGIVAGKERTLHEIEHEILRKLNDPRIHTAIVCASISCPDLRSESYTPEHLERQLDEQAQAFIENSSKGLKIDAGKQRIYLSPIFKWFAEDFEGNGGVLAFISNYVSPADRKLLLEKNNKISHFEYNWGLNGN